MNVIVTPSGADLIEEVASRLEGRGKDYSKSLVVFPGKRPAHFLRKGLAGKIGSSFIPPVIFSIDEFVDSVCEGFGVVKKLETVDAVALLYDIHKNSPNQLGGGSFMTPDSFFPLGLKIYRDIEELAIEDVPPGQLRNVEAYLAEGIPPYTEERMASLTSFYEEFYKKVASLGFSTRSKRYQLASDEIERAGLDRFDRILFAGFFALTRTEKNLFRTLLSYDNTLFLFQQGIGLAEKLKELGISQEPPEKAVTAPEVHFYSSPDSHGEVLALGSLLETMLESGTASAESTVILLPSSDTLFPLLRQGLSQFADDTYNISLGYPLFRTPVFGFLNSLMDLVTSMDGERVYIPDYLKFVLHPYTKNIYFMKNSETTRILFHTLEEQLLGQKGKTFTTLEEIEESKTLFRQLLKILPDGEEELTEMRLRAHLKQIHSVTIHHFLSFKNIADFARKGIDLLVFIFNNSTAKLHPLYLPFSESLIDALEVLSHSLMKEVSFKERSSYFIFLRKYLATCRTPFPGTPLKGLQVLGALETRNLKFKSIFVLDANEEVLPETKKEESLIPFRAREILALPTYVDRDKLTAYYFETLIAGADHVHLFFVENDKREKSRFVEKLLWQRQKKEKSTEVRDYIKPIQYQVNLVNRGPEPIAKVEEVVDFLKEFTFSATALDRYLKCPLQFYYASVLKLRPKGEISGNIERDEVGNFVHTVLKNYFSGKRGRPLREPDLNKEEMEGLVETLFEESFGKDPSGALYLLKRQVKKHLTDFLEDYTIPLIKENRTTILACEEEISVAVSSFKLAGKMDRIERRNDKITIVDYKTGSNEAYLKIDMNKLDINRREEWNRAIGSLQLPFYILLYHEKEKTPIEELDAMYLLLGRSKIGKEIELPLFDNGSANERFAPLKRVILELLQEITDPKVPFGPASDKKRACPACDYRYICGTQWILK